MCGNVRILGHRNDCISIITSTFTDVQILVRKIGRRNGWCVQVPGACLDDRCTLVPLISVPLISAVPLISTQFVCDQFFYLAKPLISATSH